MPSVTRKLSVINVVVVEHEDCTVDVQVWLNGTMFTERKGISIHDASIHIGATIFEEAGL